MGPLWRPFRCVLWASAVTFLQAREIEQDQFRVCCRSQVEPGSQVARRIGSYSPADRAMQTVGEYDYPTKLVFHRPLSPRS